MPEMMTDWSQSTTFQELGAVSVLEGQAGGQTVSPPHSPAEPCPGPKAAILAMVWETRSPQERPTGPGHRHRVGAVLEFPIGRRL